MTVPTGSCPRCAATACLLLAAGLARGVDSEIFWSERTDRDLPSAAVHLRVDLEVHDLEKTSGDGEGLVSKDGRYCAYSYMYDSNHDGVVDFKDRTRVVVLKVGAGGLETLKTIDGATSFDITSDARKFTWTTQEEDGFHLKKCDLLTGAEQDLIAGATWISQVKISPDDQWCAFYLSKGAIDDQVVVAGRGTLRVVSGFVGNGWSLAWVGGTLLFLDNATHGYVAYDPAAERKLTLAEVVPAPVANKHIAGWPATVGKGPGAAPGP